MNDSKKNIIIVSARGSGTHLLTDLIVNNFGYTWTKENYLDFSSFQYPKLNGLNNYMKEGNAVSVTHAHDFKDYHKHKHPSYQLDMLDNYFNESKIIILYRDIRDTINSYFHKPYIQSKYESFQDFYDNFDYKGYEIIDQQYSSITDLLIQYYTNWFSVYKGKDVLNLDVEIISFEEIVNSYESSLLKIGKFLDTKPTNIDVRLPHTNTNVINTTKHFRNGLVGDWKHTMDSELGNTISKKYNTLIGNGMNCFINDIKIHDYHIPEKSKLYETNWKLREETVDKELANCSYEFLRQNDWVTNLIANRYTECSLRGTDLRYKHKVFYYDKYVLKFVSSLKMAVDKKVHNSVSEIIAKETLLTISRTNSILYKEGIVPKLISAGIYNKGLYIIQERCDSYNDNVLCTKYDLYPDWGDWSWTAKYGVDHHMLAHFFTALKHNIVLTDIFNVYNCAFDNSRDLKYFDLDGIKYFHTRQEMIKSQEYKNAMGIVKEVQA